MTQGDKSFTFDQAFPDAKYPDKFPPKPSADNGTVFNSPHNSPHTQSIFTRERVLRPAEIRLYPCS